MTDGDRPLALALSGGGFRATLFHLGMIRYLRATSQLGRVRRIAAVSGGSILAAHLVTNWSRYNGTQREFEGASAAMLRFTSRDVRGRILRRVPWLIPLRLLPKAARLPRTTTDLLLRELRTLYGAVNLADIGTMEPGAPAVSFVATNLTHPGISRFEKNRVVVDPLGDDARRVYDGTSVPLHLAVACSAAYPAFFSPVCVTEADLQSADGYGEQYHTDGGVIDNQGLQALLEEASPDECLIISDASCAAIDSQPTTRFGLLSSGLRSMELMMAQLRRSNYEDLIRETESRVIRVDIDSLSTNPERALRAPIISQLPHIRTDLDAFDGVERRELVHHGFYSAHESALRSGFDDSLAPRVPLELPSRVAKHLRARFRTPLRLISFKDPVSVLTVLVAAALLAWAGSKLEDVRSTVAQAAILYSFAEIRSLPVWSGPNEPPVPVTYAQSVDLPSENEGFRVLEEDRVWDLRGLRLAADKKSITGAAYMTRFTDVVRTESGNEFSYWFESSGSIRVWLHSDDKRLAFRLLGPPAGAPPQVVNGPTRMYRYKGIVDCSKVPAGERFQLVVQAEYRDSFRVRPNWWVGMNIVDPLDRAAMRVIFPETLPYRNPVFRRYPIGSRLESVSFEGEVIRMKGHEPELVWRVEEPKAGSTYRVNWDWYPVAEE